MDDLAVSELLQSQEGVVSRRQLLTVEVTDSDIERKLRRREWARVHPGVYVEHTGPLTWLQQAWAAVLCAYSVLERHYLVHVERPHGLPTGKRQRRALQGERPAFRDVDHIDLATVIELDGRLGHEEARDRWGDLDRDLAAVVAGELTLRVVWGQVLEPCRLARIVGGILIARGGMPTLRGCSKKCPVNDLATSPATGAGEAAAS